VRPAVAMEPLTADDPVEVGGYRLRARLGAGGMGQVYLAFSLGGRPVAVKVVRPGLGEGRDFRRRFRRETEAARQVHGLYTAQVLEADPEATPPWLVTAYVPGPSLREVIEHHGPMPAQTVLLLIAGVAEALLAIHQAGLVHRDLKPSNVLIAPDGPRVIDFGIARPVEATTLTQSDMRVGTPQFMAPEHITGRPVTPAMDVFSLGAVAGYAATGRSPFLKGSPAAVLHRIVHEPPDLEGCPAELRDLIEGCLAKDPAARPVPMDIMAICRARTVGQTARTAQAWLPPALAATVMRYAAPPSLAEPG
jgi:serine/threonine protein kinase